MSTYIDNSLFLELVSEIAEQMTEAEFKEQTHKVNSNGDWVFQDDAQDYFNEKCDEIETMFNDVANMKEEIEFQKLLLNEGIITHRKYNSMIKKITKYFNHKNPRNYETYN